MYFFIYSLYRIESEFIDNIIKVLLQKLDRKHPIEFRGLFIYDVNYTKIESLVTNDSKEVQINGIWGHERRWKNNSCSAIFHRVLLNTKDLAS